MWGWRVCVGVDVVMRGWGWERRNVGEGMGLEEWGWGNENGERGMGMEGCR